MIWTVHSKPTSDPQELADSLVVVPEGVSTWALVFAPFWLVFHKLWLALVAYVIFIATVLALFSTPWLWGAYAVAGLPGLYLWLEGNQLKRGQLERKGYGLLGVVEAGDQHAAEIRALAAFASKHASAEKSTPLPDRRARPNVTPPEGSIGLFGA